MKFSLIFFGIGSVLAGCTSQHSCNKITTNKQIPKIVNQIRVTSLPVESTKQNIVKISQTASPIILNINKPILKNSQNVVSITQTSSSIGSNSSMSSQSSSTAIINNQDNASILTNSVTLDNPVKVDLLKPIQILSPSINKITTLSQAATIRPPILRTINTSIPQTISTSSTSLIQPIEPASGIIKSTQTKIIPEVDIKINTHRVSAYQEPVFPRIVKPLDPLPSILTKPIAISTTAIKTDLPIVTPPTPVTTISAPIVTSKPLNVVIEPQNINGYSTNLIKGKDNFVTGTYNQIQGTHNVLTGQNNLVNGVSNKVQGSGNKVQGGNNFISGSGNIVGSKPLTGYSGSFQSYFNDKDFLNARAAFLNKHSSIYSTKSPCSSLYSTKQKYGNCY